MTFIVDKTLGKLAKWLRILGYDTFYWRFDDPEEIWRRARDEGRTLITKDTTLYKKGKGSSEALLIREDNPFRQLREVVHHFRLPVKKERLFSRCLACNVPLEAIDAEETKGKVPDYIYQNHQEFSCCPSCGKVYWAGTHYQRMTEVVERLQEERS
jgi:uncharacterized protein with PIN domain